MQWIVIPHIHTGKFLNCTHSSYTKNEISTNIEFLASAGIDMIEEGRFKMFN